MIHRTFSIISNLYDIEEKLAGDDESSGGDGRYVVHARTLGLLKVSFGRRRDMLIITSDRL